MERYTASQLAQVLRLPEPTLEQAAVIEAPPGPLAVIAGAGSGKSETMAARLVWLVANGMVRPDRVLGLTFTRKAAAELADRVRVRLDALRRAQLPGAPADTETGPWAGDPVIGTYHAYAGRLVSEHALREGLEPSMRLITAALSWQLAASIVAAYDGPMDDVQWTPPTVTAAVLGLAADLAEHLRSPRDVRDVGEWLDARAAAVTGKTPVAVRRVLEAQRTREQLLPLIERYTAAKRAREVLDHGDQVALAARIARRHPEVGAAERTRYQVVLLDEYQDTSHAQFVLLRALFGGGHPVTAVGDPCQSIYGWRGASAGNLRRFTRDFPTRLETPAPVCQLSTSFRNAGRVLDTAAVLQRELRAQAPDVPLLGPAPDRGGRGEVRAALLPTLPDEADWIAAQAAALIALPAGSAPDGQPWPGGRPDGRPDGVRPSDIAVLCRKRSQFVPVRRALEARGIPCEVVGLGGLLSVPEVQDVVATLRVLHDAASSDALARLLTGPRWRIGPRDLVALGRRARALAQGVPDDPGDPAEPGQAPTPAEAVDPLTEAVTDLTTADSAASLIEALDDLGDPSAYSATGYARLALLGAETRRLREHVTRPLADLIAEVERALSLDIEVAARPGGDLAAARADLDAFTDVAASFAGDQPEPTLGAFLAYLSAAQQEEFGLETGRVGDTDTVKLLTVHAAKGLQWPAVFIPGLAAGERSQVFPSRPRVPTRWTHNPRLIPFPLRGDAQDLPELPALDAATLAEFDAACADRDLAEERRLVYVAATRAAFWLGCSGYWWGEATAPLGPSVFLTEVRAACEAGAGTVTPWADQPPEDTDNPLLARVDEASWPATPAGRQHAAVLAAAALVTAARHPAPARPTGDSQPTGDGDLLTVDRERTRDGNGPAVDGESADDEDRLTVDRERTRDGNGPAVDRESAGDEDRLTVDGKLTQDGNGRTVDLEPTVDGDRPPLNGGPAGDGDRSPVAGELSRDGNGPTGGGGPTGDEDRLSGYADGLTEEERQLVAAWDLDTGLLLAERDAQHARGDGPVEVVLPARLSVSNLVALARDPDELARQVRRPMPQPPARLARRGTAFHHWLEERFGQQRLIDDDDLFSDEHQEEPDDDLIELKARFEAGVWGGRWPHAVEVPFDTRVGGRQIRGRIDAVFTSPGGRYDVVDWKTGQPPRTAHEKDAVAVQLAAYRLAWSALAGVPLETVSAAFYYVRHDRTVRPADLLNADGLAALIGRVPVAD